MSWEMIKKTLEKRAFVFFATADLIGQPNVAPKFLVRVGQKDLYLVDYVFGKTWENIQVNPKAAISFMEQDTLHGYLLRGTTEWINAGERFDSIIEEFQDKQLSMIVARVAEGVSRSKKHEDSDFAMPEKGGVIKFHVEELVEIGASGKLKQERV
jgi:uncharacterized pyridoxamine 5'-phosphate oxidase family protein